MIQTTSLRTSSYLQCFAYSSAKHWNSLQLYDGPLSLYNLGYSTSRKDGLHMFDNTGRRHAWGMFDSITWGFHTKKNQEPVPGWCQGQFQTGSSLIPDKNQLVSHRPEPAMEPVCEQRHDVTANVSAFAATLPPCRNCTIRRTTLTPVSNATTTISSSIQSVYGLFFEYSDLKQNQKKKRTLFLIGIFKERIHVHCLLLCFKNAGLRWSSCL